MKTSTLKLLAMAGAALLLSSCGGLSGTYAGKDHSFFDKLVFTSGDKVEIHFHGSAKEGSYEKDGDKIKISVAGGDNVLFTVDGDGCLDAGGHIGKYCKE